MLNKEQVLKLLEDVKYPGFSRNIVSFGMIRNLFIDDNSAKVELNITSADDTIKSQIKQNVESKLRDAGFQTVSVLITGEELTGQPAAASSQMAEQGLLPSVKYTIAVASGKGGVGKSTVAANLAAALMTQGYHVGLLDLDVYGPSLPMTMGVSEVPKVLPGNKLLPIKKYGMELMSFGFILGDDSPVIWRGPMVAKLVTQFLNDVQWGDLDFLIMDLPPGTGDVQLTLVQKLALTGAIIVTTPQDLALLDVQRGANMFSKVNTPVLGIIENMSYYVCVNCGHHAEIFSKGGGERESQRMNVPLLGRIPLNEMVMQAGEDGEPLAIHHGDSEIAQEFGRIADQITQMVIR
ncbi:MAG: chromosome partitioning protein [Candidatus Marinimicrobia bacterium CG_4_9_14_3_um_filter_48_9]|nr:MAG: chromosome partitioning protein [Candidatus Marinimicrobia bacterium CG_4_9_14_3_um_filter_48_9]